jgi:hypothetical protein
LYIRSLAIMEGGLGSKKRTAEVAPSGWKWRMPLGLKKQSNFDRPDSHMSRFIRRLIV